MQPASVQAILDATAKHWTVAGDVEVTLEANPTSVEATRFRGYRSAGVNRVSLGVQALDDGALKLRQGRRKKKYHPHVSPSTCANGRLSVLYKRLIASYTLSFLWAWSNSMCPLYLLWCCSHLG